MKKESAFQKELINDIKKIFPGSIVLKNDPSYLNGIPDLIVLWNDKWACLEVKKFKTAHKQPLQNYYVDLLNKMSFARFVYPENKEEVLDELQRAFRSSRRTRVSKRK